MKGKVLNKLISAVLVVSLLFANCIQLFNTSIATGEGEGITHTHTPDQIVSNWKEFVKSFPSVAYGIYGEEANPKWLFYDVRGVDEGKYENINCIRSGDSQDNIYYKHDLYHLKEECPEIYNALFKSDRNYYHVLWEIENFYLFSSSDEEAEKQAKFDVYNQFIGAQELPYNIGDMATVQLYEINQPGVTVNDKTYDKLTKNEMLVKALQNEMLLPFVIQTYTRESDLSTIYELDANFNTTKASDAVQAYAQKIVAKFTTIENSNEYAANFDNNKNINKNFNKDYDSVKVKLSNGNNNGNFVITNPYNATINELRVYVNGNQVNNDQFDIAIPGNLQCSVDDFKSAAKNATEGLNFTITYNGVLPGDDNTIRVEVDVDYGEIITATLFEPDNKDINDATSKGCQYVININKERKTDTIRIDGDLTGQKFDLALTKTITAIGEVKNGNVEYEIENAKNRLYYIDSEGLAKGTSNDARYVMSKKPVKVKNGMVVKYAITVYNEGEVDGYAEEITDYLPEGLTLYEGSTANSTYGWKKVDNNPRIIKTEYLKKANSSENILKAFDKSMQEDNMKTIYLECIVGDNVANNTTLDNRAEITKYGYYKDGELVEATKKEANATNPTDKVIDRDSEQNSVSKDFADINGLIEDIATKINNTAKFNSENDDKNKISYEDDDDIERLQVSEDITVMDLALRKWIANIDGTDYNREPSQLQAYIDKDSSILNMAQLTFSRENVTTLEYDNPKEAIELNKGSIVTYKIAIFNEGTKHAFAEEVTDYLPQGLEFVEGNETNAKYGWEATKNSDGTTTVTTRILGKANGTENGLMGQFNSNEILFPLYTYTQYVVDRHIEEEEVSHRTLEIVCKVTDDALEGKYLTNRAEITKYGYYKDGELVQATKKESNASAPTNQVVDRDSEQNTINRNLDLDNWYEEHYEKYDNQDTPPTYFPGEEDDDDYETVKVKQIENTDYSIQIKKVCDEDKTKTIEGAIFTVKKGTNINTTKPTAANGLTDVLKNVTINKEGKDIYTITETYVPDPYTPYNGEIKLEVAKKVENNKYVLDEENTKVTGKNVTMDIKNGVITITVPNSEREFDLSLRKFITAINDKVLEGKDSREPEVDLSTLINGDETKNGEKTATYKHSKEPLLVNPTDIVTYTLRIYNEGELDGYATRVIDDVPEGVTMVAPTYDEDGKPTNKNAEYRWVMYKEMSEEEKSSTESLEKSIIQYDGKFYIETEDANAATIISTDYLSMENGSNIQTEANTENPNLIKAFDGKELDYRDIKVEFKVNVARTKDTIITNYAQISENHGRDGIPVIDRDSTPNEWKENEDDQDVEHIKVNWFDLALYKWVSSTIVTEEGKTKEYESGHTQDDKSKIVNVTVAKDKLDKTVVKFKWTIKVENQSPIPGYATEIKDHIPEGLKFVEEDNKEFGWKLQKDGTITTDYLKDTLLQPKGSDNNTAEVTVILTWVNGENNLGAKVNYAEISEDYNEYGAPDIDSTPNNFTGTPKEDDEDLDEVRLNIRTGNGIITEYVVIVAGFLTMIAVGGIVIKKKVLDKEF